VDRRPVALVHLVEFVDAADAVVRQHQRAALQDHLPGHRVALHGGGEADAGAASARGVHAARRHGDDVLQELRLGDARIAHQTDVDVASDLDAVGQRARRAAAQQQQERLLDVRVPENLRRDGLREPPVDVRVAPVLLEPAHVLRGHHEVRIPRLALRHRHRLDVRVGH
jgi:hypothetical protein